MVKCIILLYISVKFVDIHIKISIYIYDCEFFHENIPYLNEREIMLCKIYRTFLFLFYFLSQKECASLVFSVSFSCTILCLGV